MRFGFMEGDAIVDAEQAVYDPQSWAPTHFRGNGSRAERLAIVLNQAELRELGRSTDMDKAAQHVLREDRAEVVIVKCGARGAWIYGSDTKPQFVPAFRSKRVFKIGTGDIFSAVFAYHWCERGQTALEAATAASQAVSVYAETKSFAIACSQREPVQSINSKIAVASFGTTLADHWLREEARSALLGLGTELVDVPTGVSKRVLEADAVLILADGNRQSALTFAKGLKSTGLPIVAFSQKSDVSRLASQGIFVTDDFATAIYSTIWLSPNEPSSR
ncbi:carbohydrate kinase family protein [Bradyrhizobium canariense]|uniref:carbohydrate kinase family protein n=1 Tax=Bradyrhizobium canariense TaxID=255045 RepID=UPI00137480CB|nr:carbohydrate kinase family protein [Bradyrhizobium canariense]